LVQSEVQAGAAMSKVLRVFRQFLRDENGAALIEYTVLLGILLIAVIATIGLVGTWVSKQWLALDKALSP
jgi:pilus assembly protein Flp/PilA